MKTKHVLQVVVPLLLTFTIAGCSSSNAATSSSGGQTTSQSTTKQANGTAPAFEKPDVYGEIAEITGNEVTLKLLAIPDMSARGANNGTKDDKQAQGAGGANGANGGGGMRQKNYTGEQKTIVIPVGTPIVSMTRGDSGMQESEVSLNELTSGNTLSIYYEKDGKTIKKITLRKQGTGGGGQGGTGGKPGN
ncbi:hypothetical protein [Ectobacillus ponti]|uniref:Lipoprotein n=1 Tax=Ectobacillus ponti TaxID=2961894 RepID=A0AA42BP67_9BACI|nr:hypothetical protein [Ectobacillus ponti]MCP8968096.1 hypothetical protein [Ectobacillus ponti]